MPKPDLRPKDLKELQSAVARHPFVSEVRVFGSRATGHARRASDIDLAVWAPSATATQWSGLMESLENAPIIFELDVVRVEAAGNAKLLENIQRDGVLIYHETP